MDAFLSALGEGQSPEVLYQLQYEQRDGAHGLRTEGSVVTLPAPSFSLSFDDSTLEPVKEAWRKVMGGTAAEAEYMVFADREGAMDDDETYH